MFFEFDISTFGVGGKGWGMELFGSSITEALSTGSVEEPSFSRGSTLFITYVVSTQAILI